MGNFSKVNNHCMLTVLLQYKILRPLYYQLNIYAMAAFLFMHSLNEIKQFSMSQPEMGRGEIEVG